MALRFSMAVIVALAAGVFGNPVAFSQASAERMNDVQVIGSHNSFKARIPAAVTAALRDRDPTAAMALDYYHPPLAAQLDLGVRQLEIDIFADPAGGRYADPAGEQLAKAAGERTPFDRAAMLKPGFKVFHMPDVDYISTCVTLMRCLKEVNAWSAAHPDHLPIMITINAHDFSWDKPGVSDPLPLTAPLLDALDREIRAAIPAKRLITPDDVRGSAANLRAAVFAGGWPSLAKARGKLYFVFDVPDRVSDLYRAGHPSLRGRVMFGTYADDQPEAATMIVQDPIPDLAKIQRWVKQGFIVRTRSDANTVEARARDFRKAEAAMDSGAQVVSTDYYPGAPDPANLRYVVRFPEGMERRDPVR